jgi:DNA polymerase II small subunit/DNA polymerase delta subunit B
MKDINNLDEILTDLKIVMVQKHQDYGPYNIAHAPGGAMNGLLVRMHDKMERLQNLFYERNNTPNYEPIEDTLKDLANYAIIGLLVQRGQWKGVNENRDSSPNEG